MTRPRQSGGRPSKPPPRRKLGRTTELERLRRSEHLARERLAVLAEASQLLTSSLDFEETLNNVIGLVLPHLGDFGFFDLVQDGGDVRRICRAHLDPRRQAVLEQTRWVRSERTDMNLCALSTGHSGFHPRVDDRWLKKVASSPEHLALMRELDFRSMITVPLRYQANTTGALTLFFADSGRHHSESDLTLAEELARRAVTAVENARLFKQAQDAVSKRDEFLAIASHELKTPLTSIELHVDTILRAAKGGRLMEPTALVDRFEKLDRQLGRLSSLVNTLLDLGRVTSGGLELERSRTDLAELATEVSARFLDQAARVGCPLEVHVAPGAQLHAEVDRQRMEQVITNLLANALKYGAGKPVCIRLSARAGKARLSVVDQGIGISVEDRERIFGRFERASSVRHYGGLGLGLWISRQIVLAHGGEIGVESAPGAGAAFHLELPIAAGRPALTSIRPDAA